MEPISLLESLIFGIYQLLLGIGAHFSLQMPNFFSNTEYLYNIPHMVDTQKFNIYLISLVDTFSTVRNEYNHSFVNQFR